MLTYKNVNRIFIPLLVVFILLRVVYSFSFLWINLLILIWVMLTVIGSFHIRWNYFLNAKHSNYSVKENNIAITFDDGPHIEFTPKVLRLLKKYNAKATFFLIGNRVEKHPEIVAEIIKQGHTIANHTYSHSNNFGFLKTEEVIFDLKKNKDLIAELFQIKTNFFRPAFGVTNPRIAKAVKIEKLDAVGWSIRSLDTTKKTKEKILNRITKNIKKGDVVLLHDTSQKTIEILEQFLVVLDKKEIKSVTIDQLFNTKAYA
ncbi:MAG: polysaccharide deacetylase family protein [Flavobacteriaceae bacterium]|nr:polysaccharide deacetylase family protein [Flavobacteriaceae bacterium]